MRLVVTIDSRTCTRSMTYAHVVIGEDTLRIIKVLNDARFGRRRINEVGTVMVRYLYAR